MKRISWTLSLLLTLSLLIATGCSGEDPIKAKRIAIENGTYKPDPGKEDPNKPTPQPDPKPNPEPEPDPNPDPQPNPLGEMKLEDLTFTFDEWEKPRVGAMYLMPVERSLPEVVAGDPYWESASNVGAAMTGKSKPEDYPIHALKEGRTGQALEAMTIKGLKFGSLGSHIIPGALYCGQFDKSLMMEKPLESTLFGQPVYAIPLSLRGYYQWLPGEQLIDGSKDKATEIDGLDEATIACVFYDISQDDSHLNGTNLYTDPRVLAQVQIHPKPTKKGAWTPFEATLEIVNESAYKQINLTKGKYRMALIFSSSARGDQFIGAIGSRLRIDDLTVTLGIPTKK